MSVEADIAAVKERVAVIEAIGGEKAAALEGLTSAIQQLDLKLDGYHVETKTGILCAKHKAEDARTKADDAHDRLNVFRNMAITLGTGGVITLLGFLLTR